MPTIGSLFSGAGLLDIGLHLAGFEHAWLCESDPFRRELLRARFPGAVMYDDIQTLRGQAAADAEIAGDERSHLETRLLLQRVGGDLAPAVDLIAGGFPCKGASSAGKQNGFEHAETVLWHEMRRVIGELQPRIVLIENVANILGMAASPGEPAGSLWGTVLGDLAALGFDARWDCVPAAAVGAPHLRDRVFCVATHAVRLAQRAAHDEAHAIAGSGDAWPVSRQRDPEPVSVADAQREPSELRRGPGALEEAPACGGGAPRQQRAGSAAADRYQDAHVAVDWGEYAPAIGRWEAIHGTAPEPLVRRMDDGDPKLSRVRARVDRSRLSALGDGVHVYCAWLVGEYVMGLLQDEAVAA